MYEIVNIRMTGYDEWSAPIIIADVVSMFTRPPTPNDVLFSGTIHECVEYITAKLAD